VTLKDSEVGVSNVGTGDNGGSAGDGGIDEPNDTVRDVR
jgi:hypothetical protein